MPQIGEYREVLNELCNEQRQCAETFARSGATLLTIAIVPGVHFNDGVAPFSFKDGLVTRRHGESYFDERIMKFHEVVDGSEAFDGDDCRLFIGYHWLIHASVINPLRILKSGRLCIEETRERLVGFLDGIEFVVGEDRGPFLLRFEIRGLQSDPAIASKFGSTDRIPLDSRRLSQMIKNEELVDAFIQRVRFARSYGG